MAIITVKWFYMSIMTEILRSLNVNLSKTAFLILKTHVDKDFLIKGI